MHAYLLLVHRYDPVLKKLIQVLDDARNDIYIHVDKKNKKFPFDEIKHIVKNSCIYFCKREKVSWGSYSIIKAELNLLQMAVSTKEYEYYHLLSGQDLPLQTQDYLHDFFHRNKGKEFIVINEKKKFEEDNRIRQYHFFQEKAARGNTPVSFLFKLFDRACVFVQKKIGIYRNPEVEFRKGSNWFSITHAFAKYVLSRRNWIEQTFRHTYCADELYLTTICYNSKFYNDLYKLSNDDFYGNMRLVLWKHSKGPHVFTMDNKDLLTNTDKLFGRKFDAAVDVDIINYLINNIL